MTRDEYRKLLDQHDWYYQMSDDRSVYERGKMEQDKLLEIAKDNKTFKIMYDRRKSKFFPSPRRKREEKPQKPNPWELVPIEKGKMVGILTDKLMKEMFLNQGDPIHKSNPKTIILGKKQQNKFENKFK